MGAEFEAVLEVKVNLQDGGNQSGKSRVSGKGCEVEGVLAINVGIIETDTFRRVAEHIYLFFIVEVDDGDVLVHRTAVILMAANSDVKVFVAFGFAQVRGDEAA